MSDPLAYLITFRTYGSWLHGDTRGSVHRGNDIYGTPLLPPNAGLAQAESARLTHAPVLLNASQRAAVAEAVWGVCHDRSWSVLALNVRTNHIHAVVAAPEPPERVLHDLKSSATHRLRDLGLADDETRLWSRHGSTRYLWKPQEVHEACRYVAEAQGDLLGGEL